MADKRTASLWCQAIREAATPYTSSEILLDVDKEFGTNTKSLWGKIFDLLPIYAIFKADRESSDGDSEAKNSLQQAVKDAQAALQDKITALEKDIQDSVLDVAQRTLDKLREMAPELASELTPRFKEKPKWTFNFTLDGENGIPINKRGSGIRRLSLLNFFRAEAEKNVVGTPRNVIYTIEEPETSQHPNYQIMLMKALLAQAGQLHRHIIVTTHVPAHAGLIPVEAVRCNDEADAEILSSILNIISDKPSYVYRREWGIRRKQSCTEGQPSVNAKRLYRIMSVRNLLLLHDKPERSKREHKAKITVAESDMLRYSDDFEFDCYKSEKLQVTFALECCDREALYRAASTGGYDSETVQDTVKPYRTSCWLQ